MTIKRRIFLITALFYIVYLVFPLFADTFNIPVWLPSIAVVAIVVYLYPKAFANKTFYWFLAYAVVLGLYVVVGKPLTIGIGKVSDSKKIFIEFAYILPVISIFSVICYLDDIEVTRRLVKWSVIMLFASFVIAVPLMLRFNSLREALKQQDEILIVPGLPSYSLMHAYTLFLPMLCYGTKALHGRKKWLALIGLLVLCFVVYDTFVATSLIIMILMLVFTIFYSEKSNTFFFIIVGVLAIIAYILYKVGAFITLIDWMMPAFEGTPVEFKLNDLKSSMLQGQVTGGSITGRQNLHAISWNSFFHNPIFGTSVVGGHSSLMDRFGGMGMVAGIPFLMIIISYIRQAAKYYQTRMAKTFYWVGIVVGMVFLYMKGNWGGEAWLVFMVLMPMGIRDYESKAIGDLE